MRNETTYTDKPKMAICYDFDRTLSPDDMQTFTLIPSFGVEKERFWEESDSLATENLMDKNLAWMYELIKYSKFHGRSLRREYFKEIGADIPLYEGVEEWFKNVNDYAQSKGIEVEHYIISSGLKEIIEGSKIAPYITRVYASSYLYSADGIAEWPAQVVNYTTKTQFIFRIAKGLLEEYDERVNDSMPHSRRNVAYDNFVYIGDSATDIPSMTLIKQKGGFSIGVFDPVSRNKKKVYQLFNDGRLDFYAPARYTVDSPIFSHIKHIIDQVAARERQKEEKRILQIASDNFNKRSNAQRVIRAMVGELGEEEVKRLETVIETMDTSNL